jgi:hypothetical protein
LAFGAANMMKDKNIGRAVSGGLSPSYARLTFASSIVGILVLAFVGVLVFRRIDEARRRGDEEGANNQIGMVAICATLILIFVVTFVIFLSRRGRLNRRRFGVLAEAYPSGIAFLVGYVAYDVSASSVTDWTGLKSKSINAVLIEGKDVSLLRVDESVKVLARVHDPELTVRLGTRGMSRIEVSQLELTLRSPEVSADIEVLPVGVNYFAVPAAGTLQGLVDLIRQRFEEDDALTSHRDANS